MNLTIQGQPVPAIGLGTWLLSGRDCVRAVEHALSLGYRHIDTAQGYGNETEVGQAIRRSGVPREHIFLVTKVSPSHFSHASTIRSTRESLRKLGTAYIDLLLMHWPNPGVPQAETLGAMAELQARGEVKRIGVSNFSPSLVGEAARHAVIFCNQVEHHPYLSQRDLIAQSRAMDYLLTAYSPLAKGRVRDDPLLRRIGEIHSKTPAQIALRWIVQQGLAAIPKASSDAHQRANLDIFDFTLSEEDTRAIGLLDQGIRLDPVSEWTREGP